VATPPADEAKRTARVAGAAAGTPSRSCTLSRVSTPEVRVDRDRPGEVVAGFLATVALFGGLIAIAYKPVRIAPVALVVALIAAGIGGRHQRLAAFATAVVTLGWVAGMIVCVITERPLY
jgi:hypothetical protein